MFTLEQASDFIRKIKIKNYRIYKAWYDHQTPHFLPKYLHKHYPNYVTWNESIWWSDFREYHSIVWKLTNQNDLSQLEHYEKRSFRGYQLDHKVSVYRGFQNRVPYHEIAHISNLRFIPAEENMIKGIRSIDEIVRML